MPDVSGFDVQSRMAETGFRVPTVVITGHDTEEARARALRGGAAACLCKPVDDQALLDAIHQATSPGGGQGQSQAQDEPS